MGQETIKNVFYYCPICKKTYGLSVDLEYLKKAEGGITSIPIEHGSPPHLLILEVDTLGMVRGVRVFEKPKKIELVEKVDLAEIVNKLGSELLAILLFWLLAEKEIELVDEKDERSRLANLFIKYVNSVVDLEKHGKVTLKISKLEKPLISITPLEKIFDHIRERKIKLINFWIEREIKRFREGIIFLKKLCEIGGKYKKKDLLKRMGDRFRYDEIVLMIEIVRQIKCDVDSIFDIKEIKVGRLFEEII